jgi:hypothetical protein
MEVEEARLKRKVLEAAILGLIHNFQEETGLTVERVDLSHYLSLFKKSNRTIAEVSVEVKL